MASGPSSSTIFSSLASSTAGPASRSLWETSRGPITATPNVTRRRRAGHRRRANRSGACQTVNPATHNHRIVMNIDSDTIQDESPILLVPYMWIGDFVRCHSVVKQVRQRFPDRPIDMLGSTLCAPLTDYMPGVRKAVVVDLPRSRLALRQQKALAERLRHEGYGTALIMPRTWKAGLAPYFAGIPERTGFVGEARFFLLNDLRYGEKKLPRMVDRCGALALPPDAKLPADWPLPEFKVAREETEAWRRKRGLEEDDRPIVTLAPGAVGPAKRWPKESYAAVARKLLAEGFAVWIV